MAKTLATILACLAVVAFGFTAGYSLVHVNNLSRDRQRDIQRERAASILRSCQDQNARHDRTVQKLHELVSAIRDPARRRQARRSVGGTVALIDALAPHQDCGRLVDRAVSTPHR